MMNFVIFVDFFFYLAGFAETRQIKKKFDENKEIGRIGIPLDIESNN